MIIQMFLSYRYLPKFIRYIFTKMLLELKQSIIIICNSNLNKLNI